MQEKQASNLAYQKEMIENNRKFDAGIEDLNLQMQLLEAQNEACLKMIQILKRKINQCFYEDRKEDAENHIKMIKIKQKQALSNKSKKQVLTNKKSQLVQAKMQMGTNGLANNINWPVQAKIQIQSKGQQSSQGAKNQQNNKLKLKLQDQLDDIDMQIILLEQEENTSPSPKLVQKKEKLLDKKFQLEQALMDMETIEALDAVSFSLK